MRVNCKLPGPSLLSGRDNVHKYYWTALYMYILYYIMICCTLICCTCVAGCSSEMQGTLWARFVLSCILVWNVQWALNTSMSILRLVFSMFEHPFPIEATSGRQLVNSLVGMLCEILQSQGTQRWISMVQIPCLGVVPTVNNSVFNASFEESPPSYDSCGASVLVCVCVIVRVFAQSSQGAEC